MKIRPATPADLPSLVSLLREVQSLHAHALPERFRADTADAEFSDVLSQLLASPATCVLVAAGPTIAGFLNAELRERDANWCTPACRYCHLSGIVVAPAYRRQGVGRLLIEALQSELTRQGITKMELEVWDFNSGAREAFETLGFQPLFHRMELNLDGVYHSVDHSVAETE